MTVKGGTTPACAACKYQRRKCSPTCPLAPYFPANQPKKFQNVHRLFGVSNVTKTLEKLASKDLKEDAMTSIIYEAEIRERFPVDGCCAVIAQLNAELHLAVEELNYVYAALDACRDGAATTAPPPHGQFLLGEDGGGLGLERPLSPLTLDHCSSAMNSSLASIQAQMDALGIRNQSKNSLDFEAQQFINSAAVFDERQIYNNQTKMEAFESTPESSSLENEEHGSRRGTRGGTMAAKHGCRKELRTAAAGFSLTTVN